MRRSSLLAVTLVAGLALGVPALVRGQTAADTLLSRATVALNDLNYDRALLLSRQLLSLPTITGAQRVAALQVFAASLYPEEAEKQHADSAMLALRQLVRADPAVKLPREITWGGLDSLLEVARATTYVARVNPEAQYVLVGPEGQASIAASANRPTVFKLEIVSPTGATVATDSTGPTQSGALGFRALNGNRPVLETGSYSVVVTAYDPAAGDSIVSRYTALVDAPALSFEAVPGPIDAAMLRPERYPPSRSRAFAAAGLLAAGTVGMAIGMRADEPVRSAFSLDPKAIMAAVGLAAGAIWAARSDRGGPLPLNVTHNETVKRDHAARVAAANTTNQQRLAAHRVQVRITEER